MANQPYVQEPLAESLAYALYWGRPKLAVTCLYFKEVVALSDVSFHVRKSWDLRKKTIQPTVNY